MLTSASLTLVSVLAILPAFYAMSLENDVTAQNVSTTLAPSAGGQEVRKMRQIEAELELLRRAVTESKAGTQCGTQSVHANALSEVTQEIQALRSQFHALQMRRELSVLRSDILLTQAAMLADTGSPASSRATGKTVDADDSGASGVQRILSTLKTGAVYERWGNEVCPNNTELVYSGVMGGSSHVNTGAAANSLCLPLNPVLENNPGVSHTAVIFGAEFDINPLAGHDLDPRCAVCRTPRATILVVPAVKACHLGWTLEYSGYLMAGHHTHSAATEFICVDTERHVRSGSQKSDNGYLLYLVSGSCGSLPCPPYENGKVLPCAVCSK